MRSAKLKELERIIQFGDGTGIAPAIVQDAKSKDVLMLGYVNKQALYETLVSGYATLWSRSRMELWTIGKFSGNMLPVNDILVSFTRDSLLYIVDKGNTIVNPLGGDKNKKKTYFYQRLVDNYNIEPLDKIG